MYCGVSSLLAARHSMRSTDLPPTACSLCRCRCCGQAVHANSTDHVTGLVQCVCGSCCCLVPGGHRCQRSPA